jgi:hypothetical protein
MLPIVNGAIELSVLCLEYLNNIGRFVLVYILLEKSNINLLKANLRTLNNAVGKHKKGFIS